MSQLSISTQKITWEHVKNNFGVRKLLDEREIKPESLPADEDIQKLKRRIETDNKKLLKDSKRLKGKKGEKDTTD